MSGSCPAGADKLILHAHGRNKSHVPDKKHNWIPYISVKVLPGIGI